MFLCRSCHRYLRSSDFSSAASARLSARCLDCAGLDNIARSRDEFSCYKNILKRLRADEQQLNEDAKIPFLLQVSVFVFCSVCCHVSIALTPRRVSPQVEDLRYLVRVVWASCSALNASTDLYNLVFVRWERKRDWSPWNCILLSKEETSAHMEVQDVHKVCQHLHSCHTHGLNSNSTCSTFRKYSDPMLQPKINLQSILQQKIHLSFDTAQIPPFSLYHLRGVSTP